MAGKYKRSKKVTIDGIKFDSKLESKYYKYLKQLKKDKQIKNFEMQVVYVLQDTFIKPVLGEVYYEGDIDFKKKKKEYKADNFTKIKYIADFVVTYNDGYKEAIDTKGHATPVFSLKRKLFEAKFPDIYLKVICEPDEYYSLLSRLKKAKKEDTKKRLQKQIDELPKWVDYYEQKKEKARITRAKNKMKKEAEANAKKSKKK